MRASLPAATSDPASCHTPAATTSQRRDVLVAQLNGAPRRCKQPAKLLRWQLKEMATWLREKGRLETKTGCSMTAIGSITRGTAFVPGLPCESLTSPLMQLKLVD